MKFLEKIKEIYGKIIDEKKNDLTREEKEFLPGALEIVETPAAPKAYWLMWLVIGIFILALLWAFFGTVDEVAVATGKVVPAGYTKTIQAEDKGVVKHILVKDGDNVKAGDVLIELDPTITAADMEQYKKEKAYYELELARLTAEQNDVSFDYVPGEDTVSPADLAAQQKLYSSRLADYKTKLRRVEQSVLQTQASLAKETATKEKLAGQLEIVAKQTEKMGELVAQGAVGLFQYQQYQLQTLGYRQDLAAEEMEIARLEHLMAQYQEEKTGIDNERHNDIMTKAVEDRRQLAIVNENLKKTEEKNRLSTIKSPINGKVQQLAVHTVGAVVTAAQELMIVVPENTPMEVEAWLDNKDIGFVYEGQKAEIKVETFNFQKYGTLPATVVTVGTDAVENKEGKLLYRVLLKPEQAEFRLITGRIVPISAGMSATAEIKTKKKRIIEYFLDPFLKYKSEGLRER